MANKSKAKGTRAESKVVKYLIDHGISAKRKALSGNKDEGDIGVEFYGTDITLEVKTGKMTDNYSRKQLEEWLRQTEVEGKNSDTRSALVIVRYRRKIDDAEVIWKKDNGIMLIYLDDFVRELSSRSMW